jgi:predicted HTH transcriptional regulator
MILILIAVIGIIIIVLLTYRDTREGAAGICASALDQTVRKNTNKEKILEFLQNKKEAGNDDIREHLGVSRRSAIRYLDELESEGKVEQVGNTGRSVIYRLK